MASKTRRSWASRTPCCSIVAARWTCRSHPTRGRAESCCNAPSEALATAVLESMSLQGLERHAGAIVQYERPSGSPGENAAIDSIVVALRAGGVPVEVHTFDTYASDPISASVRIPSAGLSFDAITMAYSGSATGRRSRTRSSSASRVGRGPANERDSRSTPAASRAAPSTPWC